MSKILSVFITFDCTCGYDKAIELGKKSSTDFRFLGHHPKFREAETPQDLIWEKM